MSKTAQRPTLLNREKLAARIRPRVTVRTVTKWVALGMPNAGVVGQWPVYDLAKCQAWVNANIQRVHGGNRGGPNKRRRKDAPLVPPEEELSKAFVGLKTSGDIMKWLERGGANPVRAHTFQQAVKAAHALDELNRSSGKLVPIDEVKEAWGETLQAVRTMLDGLSARVTRAVVAETPLERETETAVRNAIRSEVVRVLAELERGEKGNE